MVDGRKALPVHFLEEFPDLRHRERQTSLVCDRLDPGEHGGQVIQGPVVMIGGVDESRQQGSQVMRAIQVRAQVNPQHFPAGGDRFDQGGHETGGEIGGFLLQPGLYLGDIPDGVFTAQNSLVEEFVKILELQV